MTRLWAAAKAEAIGYGGINQVLKATGISRARIRAGIRDLAELEKHPSKEAPRAQRVRRPGAGRPWLIVKDPTLLDDSTRW